MGARRTVKAASPASRARRPKTTRGAIARPKAAPRPEPEPELVPARKGSRPAKAGTTQAVSQPTVVTRRPPPAPTKAKAVAVAPEPPPLPTQTSTASAPKRAAKTTRARASTAPEVTASPAGMTPPESRPPKSAKAARPAKVPAAPKAPAAVKPKVARKRAPQRPNLEIPPILLEGDAAPPPAQSGPGERYALGPTPPAQHFDRAEELGELPEAYGTKRLLLAARDPHWLYAHWDFTREQQQTYNRLAAEGHLALRVYRDKPGGAPATVVQVHPESRHWFIHVGRGGVRYIAELGYVDRAGDWISLSVSGATVTPPEDLSHDTSAEFVTLPPRVPLPKLVEMVQSLATQSQPLIKAIEELRAAGHPELPAAPAVELKQWTPAQARALAALLNVDILRRVWIGSLEITELLRRQMLGELASMAAAQITSPAAALGSVSSPFGAPPAQKEFWFNVNAELIIYGATEPDATVTIGGRRILLRPDGTFSYRFALPDGQYPLPAAATSADGTDVRWANLQFSRSTAYGGEVGSHRQDPALKPPRAENV